jgi:GxxExxY protein
MSEGFGDCSRAVIGACIEVHRALGPGLLESAYEQCLAHDFRLRGLAYARQLEVPAVYKGIALEHGYRVDFVVERELVVEVKAVELLLPVHEAQVVTYLRLLDLPAGLLVNFFSAAIRNDLRRLAPPARTARLGP